MNSTNDLFNQLNNTKFGLSISLIILVLAAIWFPNAVLKHWLKSRHLLPGEFGGRENKIGIIISTINCFAAGVFLTTGMLEIFPEVLGQLAEEMKKRGLKIHFHVGSFVVICGILLLLYIEEAVYVLQKILTKTLSSNQSLYHLTKSSEILIDQVNDTSGYKTFSKDLNLEKELNKDEYKEMHESLSVFSLLAAISLHSLFEGLTLGLQKDLKTILIIFMGLFFHKVVIALMIGIKMYQSNMRRFVFIVCSMIFAISTPAGVFIGASFVYFKTTVHSSVTLISGILQGIACGTIFFIVFFELLPLEFMTRVNRLVKLISFTFGVSLVSVLLYFLDH